MISHLEKIFPHIIPAGVQVSLRYFRENSEYLSVRQNVVEPPSRSCDEGAMVTVIENGGLGYAATCDLSEAGLRAAVDQARAWAAVTAGRSVADWSRFQLSSAQGRYQVTEIKPWKGMTLSDRTNFLKELSSRLKSDDRIVDYEAQLWRLENESLLLTSNGGRIHQKNFLLVPQMSATASDGEQSQRRTFGGHGYCRQGGLEILEDVGFHAEAAARIASEALELLAAPNCPSGPLDLVLAPDQMVLQIHESIGHPLELDRILGDERNYAGQSFVTPEMFGKYQYGSDLLNITFDPTVEGEFASYGFDDDGDQAQRSFIIEKGILKRPLGGMVSRFRGGLEGVANTRAQGWRRPPIDRMANLNLEPGSSTVDQMIASVEKGVYMKTNCSWSIDDSRNKFQFGCEWARLIENGKLTTVVKNPNYRGISATFWRNLAAVGNDRDILGSPFCGKGEPNQVIRVGHATPTCLFKQVDVFGGES